MPFVFSVGETSFESLDRSASRTIVNRVNSKPLLLSAVFLLAGLWMRADEPPPELGAAISAYQQKEYDNAATAFLQLASQRPNDPEIQGYLGKIAIKQKRFEDAVGFFEKATQLAPEKSEHFVGLGEAYGSIANRTQSLSMALKTVEALEHAVTLDPKSEEARAALISYCRKAPSIAGGGMAKAYAQAKEFRTINPPAGARLLATLYENEKRYDEAMAVCLETLKDSPEDYGLLYVTGRIAVGSGSHFDEGISALEKCLKLTPPEGFPTHASAEMRLGQLYAKKGDVRKARESFEASLKLDPENKDAQTGLAALPK